MGLRPRYKQTKIGSIPQEWDVKSFDDLFAFRNGVNAHKHAYGKGVPFINVLEPITYSHIHGPEISGRVTLTEPLLNSYAVQRGDVLFNRTSETQEEVGLASTYLGSERVVFGGFVICGCPKDDSLDPLYSGYALRAPVVRSQIIPMGQGAIRANISQQNLKLVLAPVPPPSEQNAIAKALGDVDSLLERLEQLLAKKRDLKQAAMQQLVAGRTRLPGFSGVWHETTLGEIGECVIGLTYKPENVVDHGLLVLRSSNVQDGHLAYDDNVYVNIEVPGRLYVRSGDILVCVRNGSRALIGKCALISEASVRVTFGAFMSVFRTKYWRFIFHAFQAESIQRQIRDNIGATINQITNKDMKALRVMLPPEDEQLAISTVLNDMDAEISALEQRLSKTRELKQAMMQELLTGRTRLIAAEVAYA